MLDSDSNYSPFVDSRVLLLSLLAFLLDSWFEVVVTFYKLSPDSRVHSLRLLNGVVCNLNAASCQRIVQSHSALKVTLLAQFDP